MFRSTYTENKKHITNCHVRFFLVLATAKKTYWSNTTIVLVARWTKKTANPPAKKKPKSEIAKLQVAVTKPSKFELGDLA